MTSFCTGLVYRKLCRSLLMFSTGFTSLSVLLLFPLSITFVFAHDLLILFHLAWLRFSRSTHLFMVLSLETLTSIIRTSLNILVELIDLVNSVIIFLSQITLLRWLTFLCGSQAVILIVLLFWTFLSSDASICSTMAFPPLGNSDHVVVSVSVDSPLYSQWDSLFHHIAYDYSHADFTVYVII